MLTSNLLSFETEEIARLTQVLYILAIFKVGTEQLNLLMVKSTDYAYVLCLQYYISFLYSTDMLMNLYVENSLLIGSIEMRESNNIPPRNDA